MNLPDEIKKAQAIIEFWSKYRNPDGIGAVAEAKELLKGWNLALELLEKEWNEVNRKQKEIKMQLQQGDVLIRKVEKLPKDVKEVNRKEGRIIVMHGEQGHVHAISDVDAMFYEKDGKFYLKNTKKVTITHEEHKPFTIEPGIWEIGQVREKDWLSGMVRKVID